MARAGGSKPRLGKARSSAGNYSSSSSSLRSSASDLGFRSTRKLNITGGRKDYLHTDVKPESEELYVSKECFDMMEQHYSKELQNIGDIHFVRIYEEPLDYSDVVMIRIGPRPRLTTKHDMRYVLKEYKKYIRHALDILEKETRRPVTDIGEGEFDAKTKQEKEEIHETYVKRHVASHSRHSSDKEKRLSEDQDDNYSLWNTVRKTTPSVNGRKEEKGDSDIAGNMADMSLTRQKDDDYSRMAGHDEPRKEGPDLPVTKNSNVEDLGVTDLGIQLALEQQMKDQTKGSDSSRNNDSNIGDFGETDLEMQYALEQQVKDMTKTGKPSRNDESQTSIEKSQGNTKFYYDDIESKDGKLCFSTPSGIKVMIYQGNIVDQTTTAIVNASNSDLWFGMGVSGAIRTAAGRQIEQYCKDYVKVNGYVQVGDAAITRSCGRLKCHFVIHAVGPERYQFLDNNEVVKMLKSAILNSILCLEKKLDRNPQFGLGSISIPAISAGIYGVEMPLVTRAFKKAIFEFDAHRSKRHVKEIHLVNIDDETTNAFQSYFRRQISKSTTSPEPNIKDEPSVANQGMQDVEDSSLIGASASGMPKAALENFDTRDENSYRNLGVTHGQGKHESQSDFGNSCMVCQDNLSSLRELSCRHKICTSCEIRSKKVIGENCPICKQPYGRTKENRSSGIGFSSMSYSDTKYGMSAQAQGLGTSSTTSQSHRTYNLDPSLYRPSSSPGRYDSSRLAQTSGVVSRLSTTGFDMNSKHTHNNMVSRDRESYLGQDSKYLPHIKSPISNQNSQNMLAALKWSEQSSTATSRDLSQGSPKPKGPSNDKDDDCCICMDTIENPKKLPCKHTFCKDCIEQHVKISGPKCPQCFVPFGKMKGNQPPGTCTITTRHSSVGGYEGYGTIQIDYDIPSGRQTERHPHPGRLFYGTNRTAFLPDNDEGRDIAKLLEQAFEDGHIFTVGKSVTSGQDDCVVWNDIHHKTDMYGAPYGYPDPSYLKRVREELRTKGIISERGDRKYAKK